MSSFRPPDILAVPRPYWHLRHIQTRPGLSPLPGFEDRETGDNSKLLDKIKC